MERDSGQREAIDRFLASSRQPVFIEPGEAPFPLQPGCFAIDSHGGGLLFQVWDERRNLCRRVIGIQEERPGRLMLAVEKFARRTGAVELIDTARPAVHARVRQAARQSFREEFRRYLRRQFPGWRIGEISTETDLEHSLSPAYARAFLKRGGAGWAAVGRHATVALRMPWLNPRALKTALFLYSRDAQEALLDPRDYGNLATRLDPPHAPSATRPEKPEQVLEARVRADLESLDATLLAEPVYGQAPTFAAGERDVIDLLAADRYGRLAVVELKASQDLHLPLQALDYWMRVRWHAACGEFTARGYFPGVPLTGQPPRLFLVAPAFEFHPTTETILRFLSPEIEVERIGLAVEWRERLRVVLRARGAQQPA
jgi:hypothetical protein